MEGHCTVYTGFPAEYGYISLRLSLEESDKFCCRIFVDYKVPEKVRA